MSLTSPPLAGAAAAASSAGARPDVVRLPPRPGVAPSPKPPVRIFLGTEAAQARAERLFLYSIERHRDPARAYEIHRMSDLAGFARKGWRTGFTNYRFAIPELAGGQGKAIYNDVDQIYLADPAALFDLEIGPHGYLAVSANDTSVMLVDCARMAPWWNLAAATSQSKEQLLAAVERQPGLWGALDPGWNARDAEFAAGRSKLLHFTAMHTQPWRPFPRDYSYHPHPQGDLWFSLERAADEEGYAVPALSRVPLSHAVGEGQSLPRTRSGGEGPSRHAALSGTRHRPHPHPLSRAGEGDATETPRIWVLAGQRAGDRAQVTGLAEALGWSYEVKQLAWNPLHHLPNLLLGASLASLDRAKSSPLAPPWPDLILDVGKRSVPVARWIKAQSDGKARWVHVGRTWAPLALFDLSIAPLQYRPLARANTLSLTAPLHRITSERLAEAAASWAPRLAHLPRPWHALLVGGDSPPYAFDPAAARRLGELANAEVHKSGGSLLVTTSGRTRPESAAALFAALDVPSYRHRWQKGAKPEENPYLAYLALADSLIVTGDSASMLAEACSTGKPVALFELSRKPTLASRLVDLFEGLMGSHASRKSYRGTPQQQGPLARLYDRLVERGLVMPSRDHAAYHQALIARGLVHRLGEPAPAGPALPLWDRELAVARIRKLLVEPGEIR